MTTTTRSLAGAAALAIIAAFTTGAASAAEPTAPSATVRYGDLNLATEAGARTLYQRIAFVARQVCPDGDSRDLSQWARSKACQKDAIDRAVATVNNPHLALAAAKATRKG